MVAGCIKDKPANLSFIIFGYVYQLSLNVFQLYSSNIDAYF